MRPDKLPEPYYQDEYATIYHARCEEVLPRLEAGSVNLIATDPPYFRVKDEAWDRAWKSADAFIGWLGEVADGWRRVLAPNGSLYCFAGTKLSGRTESMLGERFNVLNRITWAKPRFSTKAEMFRKEEMRAYFPTSEAVIFAEQNPTWPARLAAARQASGLSRANVSERVVGSRSGACWNWEAGIRFPEPKHWRALREMFHELPTYSEIERPFAADAVGAYSDVWTFRTVLRYPGKHPCEKPLPMMEHIVRTSSRPGDVVLDCFMGSGATLRAAANLGRKSIGIEMDERWCEKAAQRLQSAPLTLEVV